MTSSDVANTSDYHNYETGLEDFDSSRVGMPRLGIVHADGTFRNSLTGEVFTELNGVALGMVKQRAMFHKEMSRDGKLKPQCKSSDSETGYPNLKGGEKDLFPWDQVSFTKDDLPKDEYDRPMIACASCPFSQWGAKKSPPLCTERHAYPMMFSDEPDFKLGDEMPHRGIVSFQKTGIKPSNQFLMALNTSKLPVYSAVISVSLRREQMGTVTYSVPTIKRLGSTQRDDWREYSDELRGLRDYLRQPPRPPDDAVAEKPITAASVIDSSAKVMPSTPAPAASFAAGAASFDEDELPF